MLPPTPDQCLRLLELRAFDHNKVPVKTFSGQCNSSQHSAIALRLASCQENNNARVARNLTNLFELRALGGTYLDTRCNNLHLLHWLRAFQSLCAAGGHQLMNRASIKRCVVADWTKWKQGCFPRRVGLAESVRNIMLWICGYGGFLRGANLPGKDLFNEGIVGRRPWNNINRRKALTSNKALPSLPLSRP
eukprot:1157252-Pelagomonas_calceolata.AAC.3